MTIVGLIDAALRASKPARTQTTIGTEGISLARAGLLRATGRQLQIVPMRGNVDTGCASSPTAT
jgi:porphobilinogen deaminase